MLRFLFGRPRTVRVPIDKSNVEVQQVKVYRQSKPIVARFILTCIVTTVIIQGIKRWDPLGTYARRDVLSEELEKAKRNTQRDNSEKYGSHWEKQHSQMKDTRATTLPAGATKSDTVRLTIPIWIRKGYMRMYTETDQEWKEFVKLQSDPGRIDKIKRSIGESIMHQIKDHGQFKFELAIIKFNGKAGVGLDLVPQLFTPPIYEVPCLWLSLSSATFGWRPLPAQTGARIERVFRPVVLLEASTAALSTFSKVTYAVTKARLAEKMGWQKTSGTNSTVTLPRLPSTAQEAPDSSNADSQKSSKPTFSLFPNLENGEGMRKMHSDIVSSMPYSSAITHAALVFNHVRNGRQKLAASTNVRGICQIRGFITLFGERGKLRMEVLAHYLPVDDTFVGIITIKSGYVVQDYRAWEKLRETEKKQKEQKAVGKSAADSTVNAGPDKPATPSHSDEENNKG